MSAEEDTELRDLIIQTLENNGVIGKIKAELRASVFLALEEEGSFRDKIPLVNTRLMQFLSKPEGMLVVSLVREFLQFFNMNFTLAVFEPEITASCDFLSKEEIRRKLKLSDTELDSPILTDLVKLSCKRETTAYFDSKKNSEPSLSSETKVLETESRSLRSGGNSEAFTTGANDTFSEMSYENPSKPPDTNRDFKNDGGDPFFDEPLPSEKRYFSVSKDDSQKDTTATSLNIQHDLFGLKPETKMGLEKSSLSSLKDLPSLNPKGSEISDWGLGKSMQKKVSGMDLDIHSGEGEYDDEDFHSSGSGQSAKSSQNSGNMMGQPKTDGTDNQDNSEQSIEEEIEEDLSGGVDDLLNSSLSLGDDATSDQTISQVSLIGGSDYMESCNPAK